MKRKNNNHLIKFINLLKTHKLFKEGFIHHEYLPEKKETHGHVNIPGAFKKILLQNNILKFYSHQAESWKLLRDGDNVSIVTPTASGKTLIFLLTIFELLLKYPSAKFLLVYPYKALSRDQQKTILEMGKQVFPGNSNLVNIYDGDTPTSTRKKIISNLPSILITNPDMLHYALLPYHQNWEHFFSNLHLIVIDELHVYRGIFGSNILHVFRRLRRICQLYGSNPQFITCSATIANPREISQYLVGVPFRVVSSSGAPSKGKHFIFYNPTGNPHTESARLFRLCLDYNLKTLVFTKARKITELIYKWTLDSNPEWKGKISSYRSGFLPSERRKIEQGLASGKLKGVISTSALEVGIDIGGLDCCILVGYPGSITSTWQRSGRVGRGDKEAAIILVAMPDALDQYLVVHPEYFFQDNFENIIVDPNNPFIIKNHLLCAAAEIPIKEEIGRFYPEDVMAHVKQLEEENLLACSMEDDEWFCTMNNPHRQVNIRSIGATYSIVDQKTGKLIGSIDQIRAFHECHEGAIYIHLGQQYRVIRLDEKEKNVYTIPARDKYYTSVRTTKETTVLDIYQSYPIHNFVLRNGLIKVTETIEGYVKKNLYSGETLSEHDLSLPPIVFETTGTWLEIDHFVLQMLKKNKFQPMGSLHALEHATIALFPLVVMCDRNDIAGICNEQHQDIMKATIFFYDGYPGGIGLSLKAFHNMEKLLTLTRDLIHECACETGCPACIHSPKCGSGNKPLDKPGAKYLLDILLDQTEKVSVPIEDTSPKVKPSKSQTPKKKLIIFFDLETKKLANQVGGWKNKHLMGLAVAVTYCEMNNEFRIFREKEVNSLIEYLKSADLVVGFNQLNFDYEVLKAYTPYDLKKLPNFDILHDIHRRLGFRISLNDLAESTLGATKTADGVQSVEWFEQGKIDEVIEYCKNDVELTRDLFYHGVNKKYIVYRNKDGRKLKLNVDWETLI